MRKRCAKEVAARALGGIAPQISILASLSATHTLCYCERRPRSLLSTRVARRHPTSGPAPRRGSHDYRWAPSPYLPQRLRTDTGVRALPGPSQLLRDRALRWWPARTFLNKAPAPNRQSSRHISAPLCALCGEIRWILADLAFEGLRAPSEMQSSLDQAPFPNTSFEVGALWIWGPDRLRSTSNTVVDSMEKRTQLVGVQATGRC